MNSFLFLPRLMENSSINPSSPCPLCPALMCISANSERALLLMSALSRPGLTRSLHSFASAVDGSPRVLKRFPLHSERWATVAVNQAGRQRSRACGNDPTIAFPVSIKFSSPGNNHPFDRNRSSRNVSYYVYLNHTLVNPLWYNRPLFTLCSFHLFYTGPPASG